MTGPQEPPAGNKPPRVGKRDAANTHDAANTRGAGNKPGAANEAGDGATDSAANCATTKRSGQDRPAQKRSGRERANSGRAEAGRAGYERARGGPARAIADLMPEIGRTAFRRFGFVQSSVVTRWEEIVGEAHARVSCPEAIRFPPGERGDGILQLVVEPAHAPLLTHLVPEVMERVNRFFGYNAVAKVKIRQGRVQPRESMGARAAPPSLRPIPMELGDSLRDIGDPELRAVLESLARSLAGPAPATGQQPPQETD